MRTSLQVYGKAIELTVVHRTDDPALLNFLSLARVKQPSRDIIRDLFGDRLLQFSFKKSVKLGLSIYARARKLFVWRCVTNKGVRDVNPAATSQLDPPITEAVLKSRGFPTDPNIGKDGYIVIRPGITIRLTRNIDKDRGFVNGAIAVVVDVLADYDPSKGQHTCIFTARLTTGGMILVHPVSAGKVDTMHEFLPCAYGYATIVRRAQGASLDFVRGYGYVGACRCGRTAGLYYFKRLRHTDWLPIGGGGSDEESFRGFASDVESMDSHDGWVPSDATDADCSSLRSDGHVDVSLDEYM